MAKILIGTSGFSYNEWKDKFYPIHLPQSDFLSFYRQEFNTVELNFSYYRIPTLSQCRQMLEKSDHRVEFVIKAFKGLTHEITDQSIPEVLPQFKESIAPFLQSNTLGAVLVQLPQSFHYTPSSRVYLQSLIKGFNPIPVCVEFRQKGMVKRFGLYYLKRVERWFCLCWWTSSERSSSPSCSGDFWYRIYSVSWSQSLKMVYRGFERKVRLSI